MPLRNTISGEGLVHGVDERISVDSLKFGVRAMYEVVRKLVAE
jgi:acetylornithine deacetylase/succinyl-diaminopimelate desuccinylase-like protein